MKKSIAAGIIGLTALASGAAFAPTLASAQDQAPDAIEQVEELREGRGKRGHGGFKNSQVVQDLLGVTVEDLAAARANGDSLADVAEANGVDVDVLIQTLVDEATTRINAKVADGTIDQERADEKLANVEEKITNKVNRVRGEGRGLQGANFGGGAAPADAGV